jgi:hypothetical protein
MARYSGAQARREAGFAIDQDRSSGHLGGVATGDKTEAWRAADRDFDADDGSGGIDKGLVFGGE